MTNEAIALWTETSSDPELIAGVRAGDGTAFGVLYERHVDAARKVASQYTNSHSDVDDVVAESFSRVLRALQRGDGPDLAFRAYLFTIVRRTGMDIINRGNRTRPGDDMGQYEAALGYEGPSDEGALAGFENGIVADAFRSLPERWQAVLWYTEVEKKTPKEIAPLLGLTANGVAALAYRAREALRQAYLQQHLNTAESMDCLAASAQLGAYVRGGLAKREHGKVEEHVRSCAKCAALVAELEDVNRGMRAVIAPLVLGVLGVGALEGGLPIGGAFGTGGAAAAGGAGGVAGAGAGGSAGVGGTGFAALVASAGSVVLPAAAALGIVALVVSGASFLGVFNPLGIDFGQTPPAAGTTGSPSPSPDADATPSATPSTEPSPEPTVSPSVAPTFDPGSPADAEGAIDGRTGGTAGAGGTGGTGGSTPTPSVDPTTDPSPEPSPDPDPSESPSVEPTPDPGGGSTKVAALGFGRAPLDFLQISATTPAISLALSNSGDGDAQDVTASITLPEGLTFAAPAGGGGGAALAPSNRIASYLTFGADSSFTIGDWTCTLDEDRTVASCELDALTAGGETSVSLPLAPITDATLLHDDAFIEFAAAAGDVSATYKVRVGIERNDEDLPVNYVASGHVAATQVGAPLMGCDAETKACKGVMNFAGVGTPSDVYNNSSQSMVAINEAGGTTNSASTELGTEFLPAGAVVKYALLEWSANRHEGDAGWTGSTSSAKLKVPGGSYVAITADTVDTNLHDSRYYYQARAEVTDLVAAAGNGTYSLADIALASGRNDPAPTYYGGFTLTVVYELPSLPQSRVALFSGSQWVDNGANADFTFYADKPASVGIGWTAWDGDRATDGDHVALDNEDFKPYGWNGSNRTSHDRNNAADSTAFGSAYANTLGTDAKSFIRQDAIAVGVHSIKARSGGDSYLIGSLTVTLTYGD